MEIVVDNDKVAFDGNVIGLIEELKANSSFNKLWDIATEYYDRVICNNLELAESIAITCLSRIAERGNCSKGEMADFIIRYLATFSDDYVYYL